MEVIGANFTHQLMLFKEESKSIHAQKVLEVMQSVEDKLSIHSSLLKEMSSAMVKLNIISTRCVLGGRAVTAPSVEG